MLVAQRVDLDTLANNIGEPNLRNYLQHFLHNQLKLDTSSSPVFYLPDKIYVYSSAIATFYALSDLCGSGGMRCECIHAVTSWRQGAPWYNCVFINTDDLELGMRGLSVAQAKLFFTATVDHVKYSCVLVHWYSLIGDSTDECTGMWVVKPNILDDGTPQTAEIHLDSIVQLAHLLSIYGEEPALRGLK